MSFVLVEYQCRRCAERFESLESRPARRATKHECGGIADLAISAVKGRVALVSVTRGVSDPPPPNVVDTRQLAEGMPRGEWNTRRKKQHADRRRQAIRQSL